MDCGLQSRPFGVALLVAGWDSGSAVLYHTDPSGTFYKCDAMAIGSGSEGAQTALKEGYRPDLTFEEAEVLALSTLKQVMEEKVSHRFNRLTHTSAIIGCTVGSPSTYM